MMLAWGWVARRARVGRMARVWLTRASWGGVDGKTGLAMLKMLKMLEKPAKPAKMDRGLSYEGPRPKRSASRSWNASSNSMAPGKPPR